MVAINEFPDDDNLWLLKWGDKIKLPHRGTTSASVEVLLQKLPFSDPAQIAKQTEKSIKDLLKKPDSNDTSQSLFLEPYPEIMTGLFPLLGIGKVFYKKRVVGELPSTKRSFILPDAEKSCEAKTISDLIPAPEKWDAQYPYRVLNPSEFYYPHDSFQKSRCLLFREDNILYILPRAVIFKTFYAFHKIMAEAFTNGPWERTLEKLIFTSPLHSGLKTAIDEQNNTWNIVRQVGVDRVLTHFLALFCHDKYARACANAMFADSIQQRGARNSVEPWHISSRIPFQSQGQPLELEVCGHFLYNKFDGGQKFLITKILSASYPKHIPPIGTAAFVNSERGEEQVIVDGPKPFSGEERQQRSPGENITIDSNFDANPLFASTPIYDDSFSWKNPPPVFQLRKDISKSYTGEPAIPRPVRSGGDILSAGNKTYRNDAQPEALPQSELSREPEKRFMQLQNALSELRNQRKIQEFNVIPPTHWTQEIKHKEVRCWNFLSEYSRSSGHWPKRGWRIIRSDKIDNKDRRWPRAALVVEIVYNDLIGYWIEIESKGGSGYRSPFIFDITGNPLRIIERCLEVIAQKEGRNLREPLQHLLSELGTGAVRLYKHIHVSKDKPDIDPVSILRFLPRKSS